MNSSDKHYTDQQNRILEYLINHDHITSAISIKALGIMDLRKRLSELRRMGFPIEDRYVTKENRYGKKVRYKEYYLQKGDDYVRVPFVKS